MGPNTDLNIDPNTDLNIDPNAERPSKFINADATIGCINLENIEGENWVFVSTTAEGKLYITMCMKRTGRVDFGEAVLNIIPAGTGFAAGFAKHNDFVDDAPIVDDREFLEEYLQNAAQNIMKLSNQIMRRLFTDFKIGMRAMDERTDDDHECEDAGGGIESDQ